METLAPEFHVSLLQPSQSIATPSHGMEANVEDGIEPTQAVSAAEKSGLRLRRQSTDLSKGCQEFEGAFEGAAGILRFIFTPDASHNGKALSAAECQAEVLFVPNELHQPETCSESFKQGRLPVGTQAHSSAVLNGLAF